MKECEVRGRVGRELAVCQEYTLELCTVQSWRTTAQRERERQGGRGDRETDSSGQMEPCLFWSSWLLLRAGLVCVYVYVYVCVIRGRKHITSRTANHCFLLMWTDILLLLSVEALYAAQGQEDPAAAAASGNRPIWILGPAEAGGHEFPRLQLPASV